MSHASDLWNDMLEVSAHSDVGMRRSNNQDSKAVVLASDREAWEARGHVFVVADGMGAHAAGELASKMAVDNVPHTYKKLLDRPIPDAIRKSIEDANALIHSRGQGSADFQGMGTTCSALVLLPGAAVLAHIGDSRIYRLRNHKLEQLTFDHSLVWEMMAASGQTNEDDVPGIVPKNVITRSLGPNAKVEVDLEGPIPVEPGDMFLLCSDGLTGPVKDEEIGAMLAALPPDEAVRTLIDLANLRGGPDNITVVVVKVKTPTAQPGDIIAGPPRRVHPAVAAAMVVSLLAGGLLALFGQTVAAGVCVFGGLAAAGVALIQKFDRPRSMGGHKPAGQTYGKAPYRSFACQPGKKSVALFAETVGRLRDGADRERWPIDRNDFDARTSDAESAAARGDYTTALARYGQAIRAMLKELRAVKQRADEDSVV